MTNTENKVSVVETKNDNAKVAKKSIVSREKLLEAGSYFGHKVWNPKMRDFLLPQRKRGLYIINSNHTIQRLEFIYNQLVKLVSKNPRASFIFVGTKKQAQKTIKENALRTNSFYVTERWLGGTFTNAQTIFKRVKYMDELEAKAANDFEGYTKKEGLEFKRELEKLHRNLDGIKHMRNLPTFMIVADPEDDAIAVKEARRKGVRVIGILDSNADPDSVDFGIPANDDSAKCITLIMTILADAIAVGRGEKPLFAYQDDENIVLPSFDEVPQQKQVKEFNHRAKFEKHNESQGE